MDKSFESVSPADKFAYKTQKPDSIMIWAAVASNGEKSPIFRIPDGVKINQHVYLDFLKNEVKQWIDSTFGNHLFALHKTLPQLIVQISSRTGVKKILSIFGTRLFGLLLLLMPTPWILPCRVWWRGTPITISFCSEYASPIFRHCVLSLR